MKTRTEKKKNQNIWNRGSLDPSDRSKGSSVAPTNVSYLTNGVRRIYIGYDTWRKLLSVCFYLDKYLSGILLAAHPWPQSRDYAYISFYVIKLIVS